MKAQNFKTFLAKAKKVVNSRNTLVVLDNVLLQNGFAIVSDLETFYKCRIEGLNAEINTLINFKDFSKLLEKLKDGAIDFEPVSKEVEKTKRDGAKYNETEYSIKLQTSKGTFTFPSSDPTEFPKIEYGINAIDYITPNDISILRKAVPFTSDDELRPVMCQILVEPNTIVSTDSHLVFFKSRELIQSAFTDTYKLLKKVPALLDEKSSYSVLRSASTKSTAKSNDSKPIGTVLPGKYLSIKNETEEIIFRECEGNYPNYRAVIPAKECQTTTLKIGKKELQETLEMCELSQNKESQLTEFTIDAECETFGISCQDVDYGKSYSSSIPANIDGNTIIIKFKNSFIQKALKAIDGNELEFTFSDPTRCTILNGHLLIVPLKL